MRWLKFVLVTLLLAGLPLRGWSAAAEAAAQAASTEAGSHATPHESQGLPSAAPQFHLGPLVVTNSMILMAIVAVLLIVFAQVATRRIQAVPSGAQNFWEWLVEGLYEFLESIIGPVLVKKTFWFFASIFIFILFTNWFGLIPGVGSIGWGVPKEPGSHLLTHVTEPLFRGVNADWNMTFALAIFFFACWIVWALQANGPGGFILHLFGPKGDTVGLLKVLMIAVFVLVGVLEVVSILFRPISLSFRLFGNIFAGENMLETMLSMSPWLGWLVALPFYAMELLVGVAQALVFMLLTAVFTLLICTHDEEGHGHEHAGHH